MGHDVHMAELIVQQMLLALGLMASLSLFLAVKWEMHRQARKHKQAMEHLAARLAAQPQEIPQPSVETPMETTFAAPSALPAPAHSGFNLSRRVQALRLLRRGQDIAHVSAVLGVSRREIELLIRVQRLAAGRPTSRTT